jgi:hypothetical protein
MEATWYENGIAAESQSPSAEYVATQKQAARASAEARPWCYRG